MFELNFAWEKRIGKVRNPRVTPNSLSPTEGITILSLSLKKENNYRQEPFPNINWRNLSAKELPYNRQVRENSFLD